MFFFFGLFCLVGLDGWVASYLVGWLVSKNS